MKRMRLVVANWIACAALIAPAFAQSQGLSSAPQVNPWAMPAATLAHRIAGILGPGPVQFTLTNLSSLTPADVAAIQQFLRRDLQAEGIYFGGPDSANILRITLSENPRHRLWIAEIVEGSETRVVMVLLPAAPAVALAPAAGLTLRMQTVFSSPNPVLSLLQTPNGLVVLEPNQLLVESRAVDGAWKAVQHINLPLDRQLSRDPRGLIASSSTGQGFVAYTGGATCRGTYTSGLTSGAWTLTCAPSDDPWPLEQPAEPSQSIKAFYNAARNFFTGVVTPGFGLDLPPFYSAAMLPRPTGGQEMLIAAVDGRVLLAQSGSLTPITGTRDWGSGIATLRSGCGTGMQILASSSGQAANDSLRAYSLPALEAVPASAPLAMNGTVTALFSAPDGSSVFAVVRMLDNLYEVDRVSALCD